MSQYEPNIDDVALIFEGGGMRASYTAGVVTTLLERELNFRRGKPYGQLRVARYRALARLVHRFGARP